MILTTFSIFFVSKFENQDPLYIYTSTPSQLNSSRNCEESFKFLLHDGLFIEAINFLTKTKKYKLIIKYLINFFCSGCSVFSFLQEQELQFRFQIFLSPLRLNVLAPSFRVKIQRWSSSGLHGSFRLLDIPAKQFIIN